MLFRDHLKDTVNGLEALPGEHDKENAIGRCARGFPTLSAPGHLTRSYRSANEDDPFDDDSDDDGGDFVARGPPLVTTATVKGAPAGPTKAGTPSPSDSKKNPGAGVGKAEKAKVRSALLPPEELGCPNGSLSAQDASKQKKIVKAA